MEKVRLGNNMVHFSSGDSIIYFCVYSVVECTDENGTSVMYVDENNGFEPLSEFGERATKRFSGSYCWRGVWEGRIYFRDDDEYWGEELKEMADLYENNIVPWCQNYINKRDGVIYE